MKLIRRLGTFFVNMKKSPLEALWRSPFTATEAGTESESRNLISNGVESCNLISTNLERMWNATEKEPFFG